MSAVAAVPLVTATTEYQADKNGSSAEVPAFGLDSRSRPDNTGLGVATHRFCSVRRPHFGHRHAQNA